MLLPRLQHLQRPQCLPGQPALALALALALGGTVASATIAPSNTSTVNARYFQGTLPLQHALGDGQQIAELVPLTREGAQRSIEGNLYRTNGSTVSSISNGDIAYISCNPADYPGFLGAQQLFDDAYGNGNANLSGVILYSTVSDYCSYDFDSSPSMSAFPVLSMTNKTDSAAVLDQIDDLAVHMKYFVQVQARGNDGTTNNVQQQNPLGPSPSTAVAMIILYSITGIITALFLVIILTGAIRAHRNPERYGPRNVLGRPRQSRARGLGRAILDTIPIVKFGEKEPAKPTDVELASTSEARDVDGPHSTTTAAAAATEPSTTTPAATETEAAKNDVSTATHDTPQQQAMAEHQSGIAPAMAPATIAGASTSEASNGDNLGCTICTEDFEKGQDIRVLPCDHKFHPECVDPWLLNVSGTCPLCRVDLRPTTTNDSSNSQNQDHEELAPPLNPEAETSTRRRTALRDILSLRQRPNASAEERISALRRLREQRRNQSGDVAEDNANASAEDVTRSDRRSRRISMRLGDVFSGRTRRNTHEENPSQPGGNGGSAV